ncbi:pentapeptide repeat-containing protein [Aeoliella sp.]|uniref:pentapeptide repeat-containing protein n=1 Tax=Aeoliella sp. TaxID=2795800 RepID=UPI003CCC1F0B
MPSLEPARAMVRPRVRAPAGEVGLLEDFVAEHLEAGTNGVLWLVGGPGSGKSTALKYLVRQFPEFEFPEADHADADKVIGETNLAVAAVASKTPATSGAFHLLPWSRDDLVEYLLAANPDGCKQVMKQLGEHAKRAWNPQLATIVLQRFERDADLTDPNAALRMEVRDRAGDEHQYLEALRASLAMLCRRESSPFEAWLKPFQREMPDELKILLRHRDVQLTLAAEWIVSAPNIRRLNNRLNRPLPRKLIELCAERFAVRGESRESLEQLVESGRYSASDAMAASILYSLDTTWRPDSTRSRRWRLVSGSFPRAEWHEIDLTGADLTKCDLTSANLASSTLSSAMLGSTTLDRANLNNTMLNQAYAAYASLVGASLVGANCQSVSFSRANLEQADFREADLTSALLTNTRLVGASLPEANLSGARLEGAKLDGVDLMGADLSNARLAHADLRTAVLDGVNFFRANLQHAQLEEVSIEAGRFYQANLSHAHLTGAQMPAADFCQARLVDAHLADVDWEGVDLRRADLRGASFHMGSSRSGLVGSPTALEGSMTGFYTDDRSELYFRRPEQIRKANLRGARLRGAQTDGVDFYLVDLRDAELDPATEAQARQTGAILEDWDEA